MNLPNKLTMLRILLIPVFMVVLYLSLIHIWPLWSGIRTASWWKR